MMVYFIAWAETGYWGFDFRDDIELDYSANGSYSTEIFATRAEKIISDHDKNQVKYNSMGSITTPLRHKHAPIRYNSLGSITTPLRHKHAPIRYNSMSSITTPLRHKHAPIR